MRKSVDAYTELLIIILVIAMTAPSFFNISLKLMRSDFGGFGTQIEKTAMRTTAEIKPLGRELTRDDIMLMLAVTDTYVQEPRMYLVNGTAIYIDEAFLENRTLSLVVGYSAMPANVPMKMKLHCGPSGVRYWSIDNK